MMKKVIICGTRFGQFYIEALKNIQDIEIVGILANGSERSIKCAEYYRLKLFVEIDSLPKDIDFACVAVGSSVFGGNGIYIAKELLKRGVNVIFEQPIHSREIAELYNMSILTNEKFSIGNLYNNLPAVKSFLLNVSIANKIDQPSYIMIDLNTQLSYPVSGIIKKILKDTTEIKENYKYIGEESCCDILSINIGKTEVIIKAFNEMGRKNLDTDMRMLFSMTVGYASGRLTLSSPLGPVLWEQSPNVPKIDLIPRFLDGNDNEGCSKPWLSILYEGDTYYKSYVYRNIWVEAIMDDLKEFVFEDKSKKQSNSMKIQHQLETSILWQKIMNSLGYPKQKSLCRNKYIDPDKFKRNEVSCYSIRESVDELNTVCRDTMFYHLSKHIPRQGISMLSLVEALMFKDKYKKIIVRWINYLVDFKYLEKNRGYIFSKKEKIDEIDLLKKWDVLESKWNKDAMPINVFQYFRNNARELSALLKEDINANEILFVEGSDVVAKDL
ncbi:TPA: Gfo/Idh/MocA family oxidoreductase, partial [Streptococcus equi subsp. equi]|nr:Gfo/Idh/MocA family oxidoreductase [Streptococcus equi subsp. equi]